MLLLGSFLDLLDLEMRLVCIDLEENRRLPSSLYEPCRVSTEEEKKKERKGNLFILKVKPLIYIPGECPTVASSYRIINNMVQYSVILF